MPVPVWQIPLDSPPEVAALGRNAHGFVPSDRYRLDDLWSLHLYDYEAIQTLDGQEVKLKPGVVGITPPGVTMETRYFGVSVHIYCHFRLPPGPLRPVQAVTDAGEAYPELYREMYEAMPFLASEPRWTAARVWGVLWKTATAASRLPGRAGAQRPAVRKAGDLIEQNLDRPIRVADLARQVELSPSHLARLFREVHGESLSAHIRRRRMEKASDLLLRSSLPVKVVASAVGYDDLQQFNKAVRCAFGASPRELRARSEFQALLKDEPGA